MLKKIISLGITFLLTACSLGSEQVEIPAEYAGAHYQLSESDAERWALASDQAERCIYPNLTRIQKEHFSKEDAYIYSQYVFFYPLESVIGADNVKLIQDDQKSMDYATLQYKKFKDNKADEMDKAQCRTLRTKARDDLAVVKGEYKSAMVEEKAGDEKKNEKGNNLEENKFSFDIIKWGIGLMLL